MQHLHLATSMHYNIRRKFARTLLLLVANLRHILISDMTLKNQLAGWLFCKKVEKFVNMHDGQ